MSDIAGVRLLGPGQIRGLAAELGVRPTKQLGQNFVHDANTVRRIVATSGVGPDDVVLEVGPGLGSLTLALLETAGRVVAVEIDPVLAARLPRTIAEFAPGRAADFDVVTADAMTVLPADLPVTPTALVANLPYNVAVPVILHLMTHFPTLRTVLVMVQAEVADRLAAGPGGRIYGVPSVKARYFGDVKRAGAIGRNVFWPEPKIESGLVRIDRRDPFGTDEAQRAATFAVIDAAFAQRRKTMRSALAGWAGGAPRAEELLREAGIDPGIRGERLDVADFVRLARAAGTDPVATR
ncbi:MULTISPECIES: 16S rRNA (adenine(1518)-N(6)/adenine(1519)-N(6))-dimethyltransferase RsmA [unclassified Gordonia (in: high G+C Gram-positive bacteria)]|uniref:16S rRNA (adenine(1518)-N(6)/adenine(1519)-N(6))- dimethyltransferase RsmA n=1 Tax=unclassified Gordonia (in: high G+C Gram-positive bacteria) TaxID=2657482 RepID=UPI001FFF99D1|nr:MULTISPECIES: 16S rRNA (adenine(1518)-N(6)/adenine(1519)-N(6))-dimethyltransferase RsmA [unclassified Gordonia (in: high G+C Gram-positive bacteria)]UQE75898.1 16S rRNA (adenine(1518)-N(6)/adenine(1519)-N(6))-dimethyltransferase RsmA [Gordonia sp. PP30]